MYVDVFIIKKHQNGEGKRKEAGRGDAAGIL